MRKLLDRYGEIEQRVQEALLPGWDKVLANDPTHDKKLTTCRELLITAAQNGEEHAFERISAEWLGLWREVNETVAERYRQETEPEDWDLRYFKWMKVKFMRLTCPAGEFYLVPRKPGRKPRATHWYTADEMIDMMTNEAIRNAIEEFGVLPVRPEEERFEPGEGSLHIDFTGEVPKAWVDYRPVGEWNGVNYNATRGLVIRGNRVTLKEVALVDHD